MCNHSSVFGGHLSYKSGKHLYLPNSPKGSFEVGFSPVMIHKPLYGNLGNYPSKNYALELKLFYPPGEQATKPLRPVLL